ncbi:MAG TPA: hypothetical protein VKZ74_01080 [Natronosporangium sp.]|nr:hypothetical protein [Natronosporangium sp.]
MPTPDFEHAARSRAQEAACLAANGHLTGAVYLAGYVIECRLKAYLTFQNRPFPQSGARGHDLRALWEAAGFLAKDLSGFKRAFVDTWSTDIRYSTQLPSAHQPEDLLRAAQELAGFVAKRHAYRRCRRKGQP